MRRSKGRGSKRRRRRVAVDKTRSGGKTPVRSQRSPLSLSVLSLSLSPSLCSLSPSLSLVSALFLSLSSPLSWSCCTVDVLGGQTSDVLPVEPLGLSLSLLLLLLLLLLLAATAAAAAAASLAAGLVSPSQRNSPSPRNAPTQRNSPSQRALSAQLAWSAAGPAAGPAAVFARRLRSPSSLAVFARRLRSPSSLAVFSRRLRSPSSLAVFARRLCSSPLLAARHGGGHVHGAVPGRRHRRRCGRRGARPRWVRLPFWSRAGGGNPCMGRGAHWGCCAPCLLVVD